MTASSGHMDGGVHIMPIRVYYEDTDAAGMVYHANYLRYAERARTEMLRLAGIDHGTLRRDAGIVFTVRNCDIDYTAPARLDDDIEVHTRILDISGASIRAEQVVRRDNESLVRLVLRLACVGENGRPARLPTGLRDALAALQQTASQQQSEVRA